MLGIDDIRGLGHCVLDINHGQLRLDDRIITLETEQSDKQAVHIKTNMIIEPGKHIDCETQIGGHMAGPRIFEGLNDHTAKPEILNSVGENIMRSMSNKNASNLIVRAGYCVTFIRGLDILAARQIEHTYNTSTQVNQSF